MTRSPRRRVRVVINPAARAGRGIRALHGLDTSLPDGLIVEWEVSRSAAHLRDLVAEAESAGPGIYDAVAIAGGDGSIRDALGALHTPNRIPLGVIPIGSGNDFARDLGIPRKAAQALAVIGAGRCRKVDLGLVADTGKRYCCVASVGLDEVALEVVQRFGFARSKALNIVAALWALFVYRPRPLRISWQGGGFEGEVMFAAVTNTRGYAGGFMVSPRALVADGALDLCIVRRAGLLTLLSRLRHVLRGTHAGLPEVVLARSPWFTIESLSGRAPAVLDGELCDAQTPLTLTCQSGALEVLAPPGP